MSYRVWYGLAAWLMLSCGGCAVQPVEEIQPGERPSIETDEAGLWMYMDTIEGELKSSGRVVADPALNAYVGNIICRLTPEYCRDIRFYIVRTPHFNATMAPNGFMQIWTGLLLRSQNEAQLAYVLGHEVGHYQRRHSIQRWRDARGKTNFASFFQVLSSAAGVGYAGSIAQLAAYASILSFSRDQEREADDVGIALMTNANYEPTEAARVWETLLAEREASDEPQPSVFLSTHPATRERIDTLEDRAGMLPAAGVDRRVGRQTHQDAIRPFRTSWLRDEFRTRRYAETQVLIQRLLEDGDNVEELRFVEGEFYRLRGEDGDLDRAISAYTAALETGNAPPATHRSLGLAYWRTGRHGEAHASFLAYLRAAPHAGDREMIQTYLERLTESPSKE